MTNLSFHLQRHIAKHRGPGQAFNEVLISCDRLINCLRNTIKYEGYTGLYRGWRLAIVTAQFSNVILFGTYEMTCLAIDAIDETT